MPDAYDNVAELDPAVAEQLIRAMELRATEPRQQAMLATYLDELDLPGGARVLEIGCGSGAISRALAARSEVGEVLGVDPSPAFVQKARQLAAGSPNVAFELADGRDLPLPDATFDAVVLHTVISHVPEPERVLAQAFRVLRPHGRLAVFDGDYNTVTLATAKADPLQACAAAFVEDFVNDPWIVRRLPRMMSAAGLADVRLLSHGYAQTSEPSYLLSIADRGADTLLSHGCIGPDLAHALKAEARRRVQEDAFFGYIAYASVIALKPG